MVDRRNGLVIGALAALGLSVAGQVSAAALRPPGPLEIALFAALEIVFSVLAAYALAGRVAERGFLQNGKRAGFGALMRLREAGDTLDRLQAVVQKKKVALAKGGKLNQALTLEYFDHVLSITEELKGTVLAARQDWLEVFGEDLRGLRTVEELARQKESEIRALEQQVSRLKPGGEERDRLIDACEARVRLIDERIERLQAGLPLTVQTLAPQFRDILSPAEGEVRDHLVPSGFQPLVIRTEAVVPSDRPAVKDRSRNRKLPERVAQPVTVGTNGHV